MPARPGVNQLRLQRSCLQIRSHPRRARASTPLPGHTAQSTQSVRVLGTADLDLKRWLWFRSAVGLGSRAAERAPPRAAPQRGPWCCQGPGAAPATGCCWGSCAQHGAGLRSELSSGAHGGFERQTPVPSPHAPGHRQAPSLRPQRPPTPGTEEPRREPAILQSPGWAGCQPRPEQPAPGLRPPPLAP